MMHFVRWDMETAKCKKCYDQHPVDVYRGMKFYVCPVLNRVLLLNDGEQDEKKADELREDPANP